MTRRLARMTLIRRPTLTTIPTTEVTVAGTTADGVAVGAAVSVGVDVVMKAMCLHPTEASEEAGRPLTPQPALGTGTSSRQSTKVNLAIGHKRSQRPQASELVPVPDPYPDPSPRAGQPIRSGVSLPLLNSPEDSAVPPNDHHAPGQGDKVGEDGAASEGIREAVEEPQEEDPRQVGLTKLRALINDKRALRKRTSTQGISQALSTRRIGRKRRRWREVKINSVNATYTPRKGIGLTA